MLKKVRMIRVLNASVLYILVARHEAVSCCATIRLLFFCSRSYEQFIFFSFPPYKVFASLTTCFI